MKFCKMHGAGNDFLMINDMDETLQVTAELVNSICARHFGVGADGLVILRPSSRYDFTMIYYNSDGSRAEMCGNGARCAVRFAVSEEIASGAVTFNSDSGKVSGCLRGDNIEISLGDVREMKLNLEVEDCPLSYAVAGVPHAVIFAGDSEAPDQRGFVETARKIRYSDFFSPGGANVNMVRMEGDGYLSYRTYERGVEEETMACGTGAAAVSVIAAHLGKTESPVTCRTAGGDELTVRFRKKDYGASDCFLTGPAVEVFRGTIDISAFRK